MTEKIVLAISLAALIVSIYTLGVNIGQYRVFKRLAPREMFPVIENIADEISKDEEDKRKMSIAMLLLMRAVLKKF